jgi:hypothetical protein
MTLPRFVGSLWLEGFSLLGDLRFDFVGMGLSLGTCYVIVCIVDDRTACTLRGPEAR